MLNKRTTMARYADCQMVTERTNGSRREKSARDRLRTVNPIATVQGAVTIFFASRVNCSLPGCHEQLTQATGPVDLRGQSTCAKPTPCILILVAAGQRNAQFVLNGSRRS